MHTPAVRKLNVLFFGAGSMSIPLAALLASAGHRVTTYVRPKTIQRRPKEIPFQVVATGSVLKKAVARPYRPTYVDKLPKTKDYDYVLAPLPHTALSAALPVLSKIHPDVPIVLIGNHWDDFALTDKVLGERYFYGFPHFGGALDAGIWYGSLRSAFSLGEPDGRPSRRLQMLATALADAGLKPTTRTDMRDWFLAHFAFNAGMMAAAIHARGLLEMMRNGEYARLAIRCMREGFEIVRARGVDPDRFQSETGITKLPEFLSACLVRLLSHMAILKITAAHTHTGSEEMCDYAQRVIATGKEFGIATPNLSSTLGALREFRQISKAT